MFNWSNKNAEEKIDALNETLFAVFHPIKKTKEILPPVDKKTVAFAAASIVSLSIFGGAMKTMHDREISFNS